MFFIPSKGEMRVQTNAGSVGAASPGTAVTAHASSSAKGTPAELISSTSFDTYWVRIVVEDTCSSGSATGGALDLLVGASTEEVAIADMLVGQASDIATANLGSQVFDFPLYIPSGTRIAAQFASEVWGDTAYVAVWLYGGHGSPMWRVGSKVTTYGISAPVTGVSLTPGNGTEGAWTQIVASTTSDHFCFVPSLHSVGDTSGGNKTWKLNIGTGSATEEEIGMWTYTGSSVEAFGMATQRLPAFRDVPSGTRLAARLSIDSTTGNYLDLNCAVHAVT